MLAVLQLFTMYSRWNQRGSKCETFETCFMFNLDKHCGAKAMRATTNVEKTSLKKWIHAVWKHIAVIPCHSIYQLLVNVSGVDSYNTLSDKVLQKVLENSFITFMTSTKCEIKQFHIEVMHSWQRNVEKKTWCTCCLATLNLLLFCPSHSSCSCHCCSNSTLSTVLTQSFGLIQSSSHWVTPFLKT